MIEKEKKLYNAIYEACSYAATKMGPELKKGTWFLSQWKYHKKVIKGEN